jgi:hypothetical protein
MFEKPRTGRRHHQPANLSSTMSIDDIKTRKHCRGMRCSRSKQSIHKPKHRSISLIPIPKRSSASRQIGSLALSLSIHVQTELNSKQPPASHCLHRPADRDIHTALRLIPGAEGNAPAPKTDEDRRRHPWLVGLASQMGSALHNPHRNCSRTLLLCVRRGGKRQGCLKNDESFPTTDVAHQRRSEILAFWSSAEKSLCRDFLSFST